MQILKNVKWRFMTLVFLLPIFYGFSSDVPNSHERALSKLLKSYEKELNLLVPELAKNPKSEVGKEFGQLYFLTDSALVVNHITPDNIKPPKDLEVLADKPTLKVTDFLKLAAGLYKSNFEYSMDRDELVIQPLTDSDDEKRFVYQYRLSIPVQTKGKVNGQVVVDFKKDVDLFVLLYIDSKRSIKYAKIQAIQYQDGKSIPPIPGEVPPVEPKKEEPKKEDPKNDPNSMDIINWLPAKKQATVIEYATKAAKGASEAELERMKKDLEVLFDESGFVTVKTKDGQSLHMARKAFLTRAAKTKAEYEIVKGTFAKFDQFRANSRDSYFCRLTTIANATRFENGIPIGASSIAPRMPVKGDIPAREYWKIIELTINEQ
ncbi:hypothetical protein P1X15_29650 [Runella sp. MFBS21]|uniref:hypothetical protein n=1 Tax=Runella sp. MFBS21 TaxID=3034018 RepID=UPI0023F9AA78|nr:hypothetical protein [Runella sp. MFBS21]MDF7821819.1 hypothetical protein [Runella sp. MFBS21]